MSVRVRDRDREGPRQAGSQVLIGHRQVMDPCEQLGESHGAVDRMEDRRDGRQEAWGHCVVVAAPFTAPVAADSEKIGERVLALVNQARAKPRKCGSIAQPAVPALKASALLDAAALAHARDMTSHNRFEHTGSDGSTVADRVTRAGYVWQHVGENIAAGSRDAESVVQGWLDSPGHCRNIMGAQFREIADTPEARKAAARCGESIGTVTPGPPWR